jgi:cytochrome c biogenesis protein
MRRQSAPNAIRNKGEDRSSLPEKGVKQDVYGFLSSLRFTIFLLSFIAASSVIGTLIKQKADAEEYVSMFSQGTYRIIKFFSLDDVYHSPWFLAAILLFAINLAFCTWGRFRRFIKGRKEYGLPDENRLSGMDLSFRTKETDYAGTMGRLKSRYKCVYEEDQGAVLEKGGLSRWGVFIIHSSIIIILLGSLIGLLFGYKGPMVLHKGEMKDRIPLRGGSASREQPLGFTVKCIDFKVSFYPGGEPKDYVSTLEVIEKGKVVRRKEIRVNDPLDYRGIHFYQATYGKTAVFQFNIGGESVILRERETFRKGDLNLIVVRFESNVHNFGAGVMVGYVEKGEPRSTWFLKDVDRMREKNLMGVDVRLEGIKEDLYTGLEVAWDPGVWVVWTGFAMILFGMYVNFFIYHRRIYARKTQDGIVVAGTATRNKEAFKEEFEKIQGVINGDKS